MSGFIARVTLTQRFSNPYQEPIEAIYTFPMSERSAVDVRWQKVELVRMGNKWELSSSRGAVTGFQITLQAKTGPGRQSLSDEIVLDLNHELQKTLRLRVVGYSPSPP